MGSEIYAEAKFRACLVVANIAKIIHTRKNPDIR